MTKKQKIQEVEDCLDGKRARRPFGKPDFIIERTGSTFVCLRPTWRGARAWLKQHLVGETITHRGAVLVDQHYIEDIYDGFTAEGFSCAEKEN